MEIIAKQMKANIIVDEAALDQGIFKRQGGVRRANKLFDAPKEAHEHSGSRR